MIIDTSGLLLTLRDYLAGLDFSATLHLVKEYAGLHFALNRFCRADAQAVLNVHCISRVKLRPKFHFLN